MTGNAPGAVVRTWLRLVLPLVSSTLVACSTSERSPDVLGVRIGMDVAEARRVLEDANYKVWVDRLSLDGGDAAVAFRLHAARDGGIYQGRRADHVMVTVLPPPHAAVMAVTRSVVFPDGRMPSPEMVTAALRQRYGEPAGAPARHQLLWAFDGAGQAQQAGTLRSPPRCQPQYAEVQDAADYRRLVEGGAAEAMQVLAWRDRADCGLHLAVQLHMSGARVHRMEMTLADVPRALRGLEATWRARGGRCRRRPSRDADRSCA